MGDDLEHVFAPRLNNNWEQKRNFLKAYRKQFETDAPDAELPEEIEKKCEILIRILLKDIIDTKDESFIIDNFAIEIEYLKLCSEVVGSLCNLTSKRRCTTFLKLDVLDFIQFILSVSKPTDVHSKYKPKISQEYLQKVLLAAQGKSIQVL
jgi:hypothetical protein